MNKKNNLIFFLNRRCTVGCASCNAGVLTEKGNELSPQWLEDFFRLNRDLPFSHFIIWTGGEPFFSFEALKKGVSLAEHLGFSSEILSSGMWFNTHPGYLEILASVGSFSLRVSLDAEHQERIPMALIIALIKKALELKIEVNFTLREIPGKSESVDYFLEEIKEELPDFYRENSMRSRWLHYIPHMPVSPLDGQPDQLRKSRRSGGGKWQGPCKMAFKDIVIGEDGKYYPCCGLFGITRHERLVIGDPLTQSWRTLDARQQQSPLFQMLKQKGPYGICLELGLDPQTWNWASYQSPCSLCLALFHRYADRIFRILRTK